jgi:hypothetical protein
MPTNLKGAIVRRRRAVVSRRQLAVCGAVLVGATALALLLAFHRRASTPTGLGAAAASGAVQEPSDLLCDLYVTTPNASWSKLQRGIGGAMGILPATLPGVVVGLADLDVRLGGELDGASPMYAAIAGAPSTSHVSTVIAMKVVDARRARAALVDGDGARYTANVDAGTTFFVPKGSSDRHFDIALTSNGYLLVGNEPNALTKLGPYVSRTLPSRPLPQNAAAVAEIPRRAMNEALVPELSALWQNGKAFLLAEDARMRAAHHRAPDFGDPAAIVAALDGVIGRRMDVLRDLDRVRFTLDVTDDAAVLDVTLTPAAGQGGAARTWVDGMRLGDASPALSLPATSTLATSFRDAEEARADQGKSLEASIGSALGPRLKDPAKLHAFVEAATKARGDAFALAVGAGADDPFGVFVRAPVRDAAAVDDAMRGLLDVARGEPFKEMLHVRDVGAPVHEEAGDLGKVDVTTIHLVRDTAKTADAGAHTPALGNSSSGLAWTVRDGALLLGIGSEPLVTLKTAAKATPRLADEPSLQRFATAVGNDATTVLVVQPLRLDPKRAGLPTAPLGIALGRKASDGFLHIDVADSVLREAARWAMGF